jgi:hypothetical protein
VLTPSHLDLRHSRGDGREAILDLHSDLVRELLDHELDIWIHGSQLLLPSGEVLVILQIAIGPLV